MLAVSAVQAQAPARVRGIITAVDGNTVAVKNRDGQDLKVVLTDKTAIAAVQALKLSDIKARRRRWRDHATGPRRHALTLTYKDGAQKIIVPEGTPIVTAVPADRSALKPGEYVFLGAEKAADGTLTPTGRIQVSRDGVKPPM